MVFQVQFRLRQIVDAPVKDKDVLLKELEEFAFRGIPDVHKTNIPVKQDGDGSSSVSKTQCLLEISLLHGLIFGLILLQEKSDFESRVSEQQSQQRELISQLKAQLADLEQYAYETGEAGLPQSVILERQKMLIGTRNIFLLNLIIKILLIILSFLFRSTERETESKYG